MAKEKAEKSDNTLAVPLTIDDVIPVLDSDDAIDELTDKIVVAAKSHVPDLTTAKSRGEIASNSFRVARTKTFVEGVFVVKIDNLKMQTSKLQERKNRFAERMSELRDEVRKPLTDWESQERLEMANREADATFLKSVANDLVPFAISNNNEAELDNCLDGIDSIRRRYKTVSIPEQTGDLIDKALAGIEDAKKRIRYQKAADAKLAEIQAEVAEREKKLAERERAIAEREAAIAEAERKVAEESARLWDVEPDPPVKAAESDQAKKDAELKAVAEVIVDGIIEAGGIGALISGRNREEPPREEWDDSEPELHIVDDLDPATVDWDDPEPNRPGPAATTKPITITERDPVVLRDPETNAIEVDHVGPNPSIICETLKVQIKELADIAEETYVATIRLGGYPPELTPYLCKLSDAVYRAYDIIGYRPKIETGTLAGKGAKNP